MSTVYEDERARYQAYRSSVVNRSGRQEELRTTPLFSLTVKHLGSISLASDIPPTSSEEAEISFGGKDDPQASEEAKVSPYTTASLSSLLDNYGLLGHHVGDHEDIKYDEPILMNMGAPHSAFLCGSQGSGKSYTLACMLENCLLKTKKTGNVTKPVAGVVFHYDVNSTATVSEAAYLCSTGVKVEVYVSPSNESALRAAYESIDKNVSVKALKFRSSDLNVYRMNKLMAITEKEGPMPLYMEVVQRILRDMATAGNFKYSDFKQRLSRERFSPDQKRPMTQRLSLLESFMSSSDSSSSEDLLDLDDDEHLFHLKAGSLTIIDLSDPFVESSTACILFDICLGLVKEQRPRSGLTIALDEAHKYMNKSSAAASFSESLLTTIREQRHNGTRVFIATQEPTVSEKLLDLCSVTIVHRFTSPAWFASIKDHLAGLLNWRAPTQITLPCSNESWISASARASSSLRRPLCVWGAIRGLRDWALQR